MIVYRTKKDLALHLDSMRGNNMRIGLVPTMGALHRGHASLIERASSENDVTVVSIFVNPTQFNDPADLKRYPRTLDQDLDLLQGLNVHVVFVPSEKEMYPDLDNRTFDLGNLDKVMEGKHRKDHFNGVAQIVSKLFEAVKPDKAYFGQKDAQQVLVIRKMVADLNMNLEVITIPTAREFDGLAMSSRNIYLNTEERKAATILYKALTEAREKKLSGERDANHLRQMMTLMIQSEPMAGIDYISM